MTDADSTQGIRQAANGRWREILAHFGAHVSVLDGKHHPCPACGGEDRFRFDDQEGRGTFYCNQRADGPPAGDGFALLMHMKGWDFTRARDEVARYLGRHRSGLSIVWAVPDTAPTVSFQHPDHGLPVRHWEYRDSQRRLMGYVCRFEPPGKDKAIRTRTLWNDRGRLSWLWKNFPRPKPLYGLDRLAARPDAPVIVAEGEKACDAAGSLMPDHVAISCYQGAQSPHLNDWRPLKGRRVIVWPDNDEDGITCAVAIAHALADVAKSVDVLDFNCIETARRM